MTDINRHRGLAIASLILGGISCFCCFGTGIGVIPAAIALVFSIIAVAKGGKNAKKLGIIHWIDFECHRSGFKCRDFGIRNLDDSLGPHDN